MRIVAAVLFAVALAQPALAERRLALIVGNNTYDEVTGLKKAVSDAHAMADALRPLGFEVAVVDNASRSAMSRGLVDFERRLQPGDTALFYFAGHGVEIRGENYLLPTDVPNAGEGEEGLVRDTAFAARDIISRIQNRGAGRVIAILDACRNNPFDGSLGTRALGGDSQGLAGMEAPEGVFVLMSAGAKQEALDTLGDADASPNSIFTRALVESLSTPGLSLVQIAKRTQLEVDHLASSVSHEQTPAYSDNIRGDLVLHATAAPDPAPVARSATDDLAAWRRIEGSRAAEDFAAYLDAFGPGALFAAAARDRIAALALGEGTSAETGSASSPGAAAVGPGPGEAMAAHASQEPVAPESAPVTPPSSAPTKESRLVGTVDEGIALSPNGTLAVTYATSLDGPPGPAPRRIRLWSAAGDLLSVVEQQQMPVLDALFSPDGSRLAIVDPAGVRVFETGSRGPPSMHPGSAAAFSPDGTMIAAGALDFVAVSDVATGEDGNFIDVGALVPRVSDAQPSVVSVGRLAFDPQGTQLAVAYTVIGPSGPPQSTVRLWSVADGAFLDVAFPLGNCDDRCDIREMRFVERLFLLNDGDHELYVFDAETGKALSSFAGRLVLTARHGEHPAAILAEGESVRIHDLVTGALVQEVVSPELSSARVSENLVLGARRGPGGDWLVFPAKVGAPPADGDVPVAEAPPPSGATVAVLYEESVSETGAVTEFLGSVTWSFVDDEAGPRVEARLEIPARGLTVRLSLDDNPERSIPATHLFEIWVDTPTDFSGGSVANIPQVVLKPDEGAKGDPLFGAGAKVADGFFWFALSGKPEDAAANLKLLGDRPWFDLPLVYADGQRAILTFAKGPDGEAAFDQAFSAWEAKTAEAKQ